MKRLAFALAAAALGAGCHSSPPPPPPGGTLDIAWSFVRTLNDGQGTQVTYHCNTPGLGIDTVVVTANGASVALPCADNQGDGGAVALAPGTYTIVVTALRGGSGGVALFSAQFTNVNIFVNAVTQLNPAPLDAAFAPLQINVFFKDLQNLQINPNTCGNAGVATYSFHLVDSAGTSVYTTPGQITCTDPPGLRFDSTIPGSAGDVDVDTYTIRVIGSGPGAVEFDSAVVPSCTSPVFLHETNDVWNLPVFDVTGGPFCP